MLYYYICFLWNQVYLLVNYLECYLMFIFMKTKLIL